MALRIAAAGLVLLLASLAGRASAQAPGVDPTPGTWRMIVEKSSFDPGPAPRTAWYRYENLPDGFTLWTHSGLDAGGRPTFSYSRRRYDGAAYPVYDIGSLSALVVRGAKASRTQEVRILDERTTEFIDRVDGTVVSIVTRTVSADGRTFVLHAKGVSETAPRTNDVSVWEKHDAWEDQGTAHARLGDRRGPG